MQIGQSASHGSKPVVANVQVKHQPLRRVPLQPGAQGLTLLPPADQIRNSTVQAIGLMVFISFFHQLLKALR